MVVVLDYPQGSPLSKERVGETYDLSRWLEHRKGVKDVESVVNLDPGSRGTSTRSFSRDRAGTFRRRYETP